MATLEIIRLKLGNLRNEEHFQFMSDVNKLIGSAIGSATGTLKDTVQYLYSEFQDMLEREDEAMAYLRKSGVTSPITEADDFRDMIYSGMVLHVKSCMHAFRKSEREAALRVLTLIENYGYLRNKSYNEETAAIDNLLQDLRNRESDNVAAIKLNEWVSDLMVANDDFKDLMKERYDENLGHEDIRLVRSEIDSTYRQLINLIELSNQISNGTVFVKLIEQLNERISYYKTTLAIRKGRADAKDEEDGGETFLEIDYE